MSWPPNSRKDGVLVQAIVGKGKASIAKSANPLPNAGYSPGDNSLSPSLRVSIQQCCS